MDRILFKQLDFTSSHMDTHPANKKRVIFILHSLMRLICNISVRAHQKWNFVQTVRFVTIVSKRKRLISICTHVVSNYSSVLYIYLKKINVCL